MKAAGIVEKVVHNKTRVGLTHSFAIGDDWYGTFKSQPPAEGDYVEFEYSENKAGYYDVDMKTLKITEAEVTESAGASKASPNAKAAFNKSSNKDAQMRWQGARKDALALAAIAQEAGALDLGAANGKKEGKYEALQIWVDTQTLQYFKDSTKVNETGENPFEEEV